MDIILSIFLLVRLLNVHFWSLSTNSFFLDMALGSKMRELFDKFVVPLLTKMIPLIIKEDRAFPES